MDAEGPRAHPRGTGEVWEETVSRYGHHYLIRVDATACIVCMARRTLEIARLIHIVTQKGKCLSLLANALIDW